MLKITKTSCMMKFSEVPIGGMFEFDNIIYVKIGESVCDRSGVTFNVVCLCEEHTHVGWFRLNDKVIYYPNSELILSF